MPWKGVKDADLADVIGAKVAEKHYQRDAAKKEKRNEIKRLREQLLEMSVEDVGTAYLNILAGECGVFDIEQPTEPVRRAEWIIFRILELEKEI